MTITLPLLSLESAAMLCPVDPRGCLGLLFRPWVGPLLFRAGGRGQCLLFLLLPHGQAGMERPAKTFLRSPDRSQRHHKLSCRCVPTAVLGRKEFINTALSPSSGLSVPPVNSSLLFAPSRTGGGGVYSESESYTREVRFIKRDGTNTQEEGEGDKCDKKDT